jgi:hypothetical protein
MFRLTILKRLNEYKVPENPGVYRTEIDKAELRGGDKEMWLYKARNVDKLEEENVWLTPRN